MLIPMLALSAVLAAAEPRATSLMVPLGELKPLPTPASPRSGEPCLAVAPDGAVFMSWLEKRERSGHALRVARLKGERWLAPITVAEGDSFFVNWADFPCLAALGNDRLAIAWPWKHGGDDPYAYDLRVALSSDGGRTWSRPVMPHRDGTATEHGFVSLVPMNGGVQVLWLDGRKYAEKKPQTKKLAAKDAHGDEHDGEMTLRSAWIGFDGTLAVEAEIDGRTCDCCQTGAVAVPGGALVAYRDRSAKEIRDISIARFEGGRWSLPTFLHRDNWKLPGCPVNGPAVDATGSRVAVAWFAMAGDTARVQVAFSGDGGRRFSRPMRVEGADPLGRADVALLEDGSALVLWLEALGQDALLKVQRVSASGAMGAPMTVSRTSAARASGFPRIVRSGARLIFAWTETGTAAQVKVASAGLP